MTDEQIVKVANAIQVVAEESYLKPEDVVDCLLAGGLLTDPSASHICNYLAGHIGVILG